MQNPSTTDVDALDALLNKGPARYVDSAELGVSGNVLIFAHSSHLPIVTNKMFQAFNQIPNVDPGASIELDGADGKAYLYSVDSVVKADTSDGTTIQLDPSQGQKLTLVTCDTLTGTSARSSSRRTSSASSHNNMTIKAKIAVALVIALSSSVTFTYAQTCGCSLAPTALSSYSYPVGSATPIGTDVPDSYRCIARRLGPDRRRHLNWGSYIDRRSDFHRKCSVHRFCGANRLSRSDRFRGSDRLSRPDRISSRYRPPREYR